AEQRETACPVSEYAVNCSPGRCVEGQRRRTSSRGTSLLSTAFYFFFKFPVISIPP
ncbi:unnamed protein product, partial [Amoebophrya sp. A120]